MYRINTLGDFDIIFGDKSILEESSGYPHKTLKLFKYFLTFRGKKILPENIIEDLWNDSDFSEPKNVLRTQISRLRRMFFIEGLEQFFTIENISGYYTFKIKENCVLDVEQFEHLVNQGIVLKDENPGKALLILKEGIDLYKGQYLSSIEYDEWIIPSRNRIHRLFLKALYSYIEILKKDEMHRDIVNICESTIQHEPYGELIHMYFIESLLKIGEKRYALSHYEYITSKIYNNLGIAPSTNMRTLYKKIQSYGEDTGRQIDIRGLNEELVDDENKFGALICEPFYFKFLYNLEKRRQLRDKSNNIFIGLMTIEDKDNIPISQKEMEEIVKKTMDTLNSNLRKGDVLTKWNENQLVTLHYDIEEKDLDIIKNRLQKKFKEQIGSKSIELLLRFKSI